MNLSEIISLQTWMMKINSKLPFSSEQRDVSAVDDDDVVAGIVQRVVDRLVLALQDAGDLLGRVERVLPLGIVQIPVKIRRSMNTMTQIYEKIEECA